MCVFKTSIVVFQKYNPGVKGKTLYLLIFIIRKSEGGQVAFHFLSLETTSKMTVSKGEAL